MQGLYFCLLVEPRKWKNFFVWPLIFEIDSRTRLVTTTICCKKKTFLSPNKVEPILKLFKLGVSMMIKLDLDTAANFFTFISTKLIWKKTNNLITNFLSSPSKADRSYFKKYNLVRSQGRNHKVFSFPPTEFICTYPETLIICASFLTLNLLLSVLAWYHFISWHE